MELETMQIQQVMPKQYYKKPGHLNRFVIGALCKLKSDEARYPTMYLLINIHKDTFDWLLIFHLEKYTGQNDGGFVIQTKHETNYYSDTLIGKDHRFISSPTCEGMVYIGHTDPAKARKLYLDAIDYKMNRALKNMSVSDIMIWWRIENLKRFTKFTKQMTSREVSTETFIEVDPFEKHRFFFQLQNGIAEPEASSVRTSQPANQMPNLPKHLLSNRVINIQEVYALMEKHPQVRKLIDHDSRLPLKDCTFLFRDTSGQAVCITAKANDQGEPEFETIGSSGVSYEDLCRLAINLMSCKNVEYEDYMPRRAGESRPPVMGPGLFQYKILRIKSAVRRSNHQVTHTNSDNQRPAHAVRGHFMVGTADRPLFGKPWGIGRFWVGPYVCGNPVFGLVIKDYHIDASELIELVK